MKTVVTIRTGGFPDRKKYKKPADLFSTGEIDRLDEQMYAGMSREQLVRLRQKLSDTFDWLDPGDCGIGSPEMLAWERRLDKLNDLTDAADEILDED